MPGRRLVISPAGRSRGGCGNVIFKSAEDVERMQAAYGEAEQLYLRALEIYSSIDDRYSQGVTLLSLARVYHALRDGQRAKASADQARELLAAFPHMAEEHERLLQELA
jgi:hypothetical protein